MDKGFRFLAPEAIYEEPEDAQAKEVLYDDPTLE
jgi:hypothetical protein